MHHPTPSKTKTPKITLQKNHPQKQNKPLTTTILILTLLLSLSLPFSSIPPVASETPNETSEDTPSLRDTNITTNNNPPYSINYLSGATDTTGTVPIDENIYEYNNPVTVLEPENLSRPGYIFTGWKAEAPCATLTVRVAPFVNEAPQAVKDLGSEAEALFLSGYAIKGYLWNTQDVQDVVDNQYMYVQANPTDTAGVGELVFENIPFGTYFLMITRNGYLPFINEVNVTETNVAFQPAYPYTDNVVYLWHGDVNHDGHVDNDDVVPIILGMFHDSSGGSLSFEEGVLNGGLSDISTIFGRTDINYVFDMNDINDRMKYFASCDLNADGIIDNDDIGMVLDKWGSWYDWSVVGVDVVALILFSSGCDDGFFTFWSDFELDCVYQPGDVFLMPGGYYVTLTAQWRLSDDIEYVVRYCLEGSSVLVAADKLVGGQTMASEVVEYAVEIAGYSVDVVSKSLVLEAAGNEIVFYYTPDTNIEYVVRYCLEGSTVLVAADKLVGGQTMASEVVEFAVEIAGYSVDVVSKSLVLEAAGNEIVFYYTPDTNIEYTVHYYLRGTATPVASSKTVTGQTMNTTITENAIAITGYTAIAPTTITATLNATENTLTFFYTANSGSSSNSINSGGGVSASKSSSSTVPSPVVPSLITMPPAATQPPSGNKEELTQTWALVNLILSAVGLILAMVIGVCVLLQHKQKQTKPQSSNSGKEAEKQKKRQHCNLWLVVVFALGIAGIVVFLFTEDLTRSMGLVDSWTIVNVIIFAVQILALVFMFKYKKNNTDNTEQPVVSPAPLNTP